MIQSETSAATQAVVREGERRLQARRAPSGSLDYGRASELPATVGVRA